MTNNQDRRKLADASATCVECLGFVVVGCSVESNLGRLECGVEGKCVDLTVSSEHCGGCGNTCDAYGEKSVATCQDAECARFCEEGFSDGDGDWRIDELSTTYYRDGDMDGFGTESQTLDVCGDPPAIYVEKAGDCDDRDDGIHPRVDEYAENKACGDPTSCPRCNSKDDDCDGVIDEGCPCQFQSRYVCCASVEDAEMTRTASRSTVSTESVRIRLEFVSPPRQN